MRTNYEIYVQSSEYRNILIRRYPRTDSGKFEAKRFADIRRRRGLRFNTRYEVFDPIENRVIYNGGENMFGDFLNAESKLPVPLETD